MPWFVPFLLFLVTYAVVAWAAGILLRTGQLAQLSGFMALVALASVGLAFYARRRGFRPLMILAAIGFMASAGLGVLVLMDALLPTV